MFDRDQWQEIFNSLGRHKLRTFLTALAVWWGIFMLVILMGAGNGMQNSFERDFGDDAINALFIYRGRTSEPHNGLPAGRWIQFANKDYEAVKDIEGIEYITGRYYLSGEFLIKNKKKSLSYDVRSVHPDHKYLENTIMEVGRFINEQDIRERRKVCTIGKLVKEGFFEKDEDLIGQFLQIRGVEYQIVGWFTDTGRENEMRKVYIPITTAQRVYESQDRIHQLMVTIGDIGLDGSHIIEQKIRNDLAVRHNFSPGDRQAIRIYNNIEEYQEFMTVFAFIKGFVWFVGIGSIIAGMIGVSNIMLIVVKDRTREIGVRKAIGATPQSIISMIVKESIFLTAISGYVGLLCGFGVVYGIKSLMESNNVDIEYFHNPEVDFVTILIALFILIVCGALAGLIPAIQAVRINPVEAMRQ